ncbi:MAG: hypothetical protein WA198_11750, partial [Candidatus Sulfotelmatobacter sp.]
RLGLTTGTSLNNGIASGNNGAIAISSSTTIDQAGRITAEASGSSSTQWSTGLDEYVTSGTNSSTTRTYDALNRMTQSSTVTVPFGGGLGGSAQGSWASYAWSAEDHPLLVGSTYGTAASGTMPTPPPGGIPADSLHWDGQLPLFETNASGQVDEIFIDTEGTILPLDTGFAGLTWFDRRPDGQVASCRNGTGAASAAASPTSFSDQSVTCSAGSGVAMPTFRWGSSGGVHPMVGSGGVLTVPRPDAITDGINVIQGIRAYDSTIGAWTTPDTHAGNVDNPMSQKPYLWNNNNPVSYEDTNGGCSTTVYRADGTPITRPCPDTSPSINTPLDVPHATTLARSVQATPLRQIAVVHSKPALAGVWLYYAVQTRSGKPYWGITNNIVRRGWEQARNGRVIRGFAEFSTRLAARGAEQAAEDASGLENLENIRNSIAPGSPIYEQAMAAMEEDSPGIGETITAAAQALIQLAGEVPP